ncbi:MAG: DUF2799 domain-containing protein [Gammaproteobacteria bacterium]
MKSLHYATLSLLLALTSACTTLSQSECLQADWHDIGQRDGAQGYGRDRLEDHKKACAEYGVIPDPNLYWEGREAGLKIYCTAENGLEQGKTGAAYNHVCPAGLEPAFLKDHKLGLEIHRLHQQINEIERKIEKEEKRLGKKDLPDAQRREIRDGIRELDQERARLRKSSAAIEDLGVI